MKAFILNNPYEYSFIEIEEPKPSPGEVKIKINRIGLCGTDLGSFRGLNPLLKYPRIPGHEIVGTIVEIGSSYTRNLRIGQKVTVVPYTSCGKCSSCLQKRENACKDNQTLGVQRDGALQEYICVPVEKVIASDLISFDRMILTEPLSIGFHAVGRGNVKSSDFVLVLGCGMIGLGVISAARVKGARIIAVDVDDKKLITAKKMGAEFVINSSKQNLIEESVYLTNNFGPNIVFEAIGSGLTYKTAIDLVGFAGRVIYIGYTKPEVSYNTSLFVKKELDILGSRNANMNDFNNVIKMLETSSFPIELVISKIVPFAETGKILTEWDKNTNQFIKILIDFDI